jgi:hypothetical protein
MLVVAVASPAFAGKKKAKAKTYTACYDVYLPSVDKCGCLNWRCGVCADFKACINVCTGEFTGSASACVENCSGCKQCYKNIGCIEGLWIKCSTCDVKKNGKACYTASGCVERYDSNTPA